MEINKIKKFKHSGNYFRMRKKLMEKNKSLCKLGKEMLNSQENNALLVQNNIPTLFNVRLIQNIFKNEITYLNLIIQIHIICII